MKSILDPSFKYTSSVNTDIAKTFARIRRTQRHGEGAGVPRPAGHPENVTAFPRPVRTDSKVA